MEDLLVDGNADCDCEVVVDGLSLLSMARLSFGSMCFDHMLDLLSIAVPESLYNLTLHGLICGCAAGDVLMLVGSPDLPVCSNISVCVSHFSLT